MTLTQWNLTVRTSELHQGHGYLTRTCGYSSFRI